MPTDFTNVDQTLPKVVVSGMGTVNPLGRDLQTSFTRLLAGESAIDKVQWTSGRSGTTDVSLGAPAAIDRCNGREDDSPECDSPEDDEIVLRLVKQAVREALQDSQVNLGSLERGRIGVVIGASKPAIRSLGRAYGHHKNQLIWQGANDPWMISQLWAPASSIACQWDCQGPLLTPVAACATGLIAVQQGVRLIRSGACDLVIAGSVDASLTEMICSSYRRLGILSKSNDPQRACCPFDRQRDGFVIGEGAGILILQRESTLQSQQRPIAEWITGAHFSTGKDLASLEGASEDYLELFARTMAQGGVVARDLGMINLHGTATRDNDLLEMEAVQSVLGSQVACCGFKGAMGHLLGAAGAVELVLSLKAMTEGVVPMTVGCRELDQSFKIHLVHQQPEQLKVRTLLKISAGFGGHLASGLFRGL